MTRELLTPDYIFESSWEVCNKVGGIYTVLSTRAKTLQDSHKDKVIFIGPDFWQGKENPLFIEEDNLCSAWKTHAEVVDKIVIRVGRWNIPGQPIVVLVDFRPFYAWKNTIYADAWNYFGVDSLHGYGDYDEASMFAYASGRVIESFYRFNLTEKDKVVAQFHEWMTGLGALYLLRNVPQIATIFTTHATSIGRSIAGNKKPLYDYLFAYNGDQMARELNMESKHSIEKQTAHAVDCFTTVSDITNIECKELLDKPADVVLMNGFEDGFVPEGKAFTAKRKEARESLLNVANKLLGLELKDDTLIVGTSGRYEFRNKGINVFLETMKRLNRDKSLKRDVLVYINVPGWVSEPRQDLNERLNSKETFTTPLEVPFLTHWLHNTSHDQVLDRLKYLNMENRSEDKVKVIFVPCYLDGKDGIFNKEYYDVLLGEDLSVYASYYEPWGYTPLESVAFQVPTITTDLAGFGLWVKTLTNQTGLDSGVAVIHRSDYNSSEVADEIKENIISFSTKTKKAVADIRKRAKEIGEQALWKHFIQYYYQAYDIALRNAEKRILN
ncbi:MAG: glycogen/starch synthase [Bacteroidaceae bacterium]